ncbi:MAG TPA: cytochrome P450 [Candidatus Binatia bacterium]|jgi:cytochrome P450|nr:cytochrome P450 [Candidatus Binatia bacterium]
MTRARLEIADVLTDPFAALAKAREAGGLVDLDAGGGVAVMSHEAVRTLLSSGALRANFAEFLRAFGVSEGPFFEWIAISPLNHDGTEHLRWRALMSRTFTPRSVERLRPYLRSAAHELIDGFAARGACEFMAEFADPFPSLGLCELIGVPTEDRDRFRGWANTIGLGFSPMVAMDIDAVNDALVRLLDYTGQLAAARLLDPRDDLVTRISTAAEADGWTDDQVRGFLAGLVFAGHETTKTQLGWTIAVLAERPDLWDAVADGTVAPAPMIEEVMRYRSAVTGVGRAATEPITVGNDRIEAGQQVFLSLWSADHDAAVYPHADRLDPAQAEANPHIAFGHGAHHCLGAALARAELQDALSALTVRIGCPTVGAEAAWKPPVGINGPDRLPITFTPRGQ